MATSKIFTGNNITDFETDLNDWFSDAAQETLQIFDIFFTAREQVSTPGIDLTLTLLCAFGGTTFVDPYVASLFEGEDGVDIETKLNEFIDPIDTDSSFLRGPYIDFQKERRSINKYNALVLSSVDRSNAQGNWYVNPPFPDP